MRRKPSSSTLSARIGSNALCAQQQRAEQVLGIPVFFAGEHDVAVDEEDLHLFDAGLERQPPGLGLVTDQLEDVGDPEVLQRSGEGHGYAPSSARCRLIKSR